MSRRGVFRDRQFPDSHRVVITDSRSECCHERERGRGILDVVFCHRGLMWLAAEFADRATQTWTGGAQSSGDRPMTCFAGAATLATSAKVNARLLDDDGPVS